MKPDPIDMRERGGFLEYPHSVPQQMPDRKETRETVLYGPRGEALVVKVPRPFGFRPERIKEKP